MDVYGIKDFPETITGTLKSQPKDFLVEEITPTGKICRTGFDFSFIRDMFPKKMEEHLHFTLVKTNYTTLRAVSTLSKRLRIGHKRFGYAGTKDKNAITAQRISVWNQKIENMKKIKARDIKIKDFRYEKERLTLGDLSANKFIITIRELQGDISTIKKLDTKNVLNYFGPQRFGEMRPVNHLIGKQLLIGNFEDALKILLTHPGDRNEKSSIARKFAAEHWGEWRAILKVWPRHLGIEAAIMNYLVQYPTDFANAFRKLPKKLRRMFIHSFQSYIFNVILTKLQENGSVIPKELPLVGYETELEGEAGELIKEILKKEEVEQDIFKIPRMPELSEPGTTRETIMKVSGFKYKKKDDTLIVSFILSKGSYATILLKNIIKT